MNIIQMHDFCCGTNVIGSTSGKNNIEKFLSLTMSPTYKSIYMLYIKIVTLTEINRTWRREIGCDRKGLTIAVFLIHDCVIEISIIAKIMLPIHYLPAIVVDKCSHNGDMMQHLEDNGLTE